MVSRIAQIPFRRWHRRDIGWIAAGILVVGLALLPATPVLGSAPPAHKVTICHATPPDTAANGWHTITVDVASVGYRHAGHQSKHDADIIPPYAYGSFSYPGKNWTAEGQDIWSNDCTAVAPTERPTATPTPRPTPAPTPTPTPTATETPTGSVEPTASSKTPPTPTPTATPAGSVEGATGTPAVTLPPTDTSTAPTSTGGGSPLAMVGTLLVLAAVSAGALTASLDARRRTR